MMQQMMGNPAMMPQASAGASQATAGDTGNPMAGMMQQMMSNPDMMRQSMQMATQMFGNGGMAGAGYGAPFGSPATATGADPASATMQQMGQPQTPASNPMAAMMQQMMGNPAMMQQSRQMA